MSAVSHLQSETDRIGREIFRRMDRLPAGAGRHGIYRKLMDWSMRDEQFKTQMFRFVDVLPSLRNAKQVTDHLAEYLDDASAGRRFALRGAIAAGDLVPPISAAIVRHNVVGMANLFITGVDGKSALPQLQRLWREQTRFTVDNLGETVVSDREADIYAQRCHDLLDFLAGATRDWQVSGPLSRTEPPCVNLSVKISALCPHLNPADPAGTIAVIMQRLKPIVLRAKARQAFVNFDLEQYALKDLTLALFKHLASEPELIDYPHLGLVLQAYLRDSYHDAEDLLTWARSRPGPFTIRLVKGAYWDYETVHAAQKNWPVPVFSEKASTDANYERITRLLLEHRQQVYPAFASHNVRSLAHAIAVAESRGLHPGDYELQMLYGMADSIRQALVDLGQRVRAYCAIGEMVPGMAYLVRRLLENTSNESFLRAKYSGEKSADRLLADPALATEKAEHKKAPPALGICEFSNEPPADFSLSETRERFAAGIAKVRRRLGDRYLLRIGGKAVIGPSYLPSINPARPDQVLGEVATAGAREVGLAVDAAKQAFPRWSATPIDQRCDFLERVAMVLRTRREEFAAWQIFEVGKTWAEADADVAEAIDFCRFYAAEMRRLGRGRLTQVVPGEVSFESYVPRGVAAVIAPWNFPLAILCGMTVAALVAGNTVVLKPAEQSCVTGALFMQAMEEAGLPDGAANLLSGHGEVGAYLVAHPQVALIAFTGSREVGTEIWATAGVTLPGQGGLKKVICEMGGKNALIVDADADLDEAVPVILQSAFGYQGQKCSALSRLIVLRDVAEELQSRLVAAAATWRAGFPEDPATDVGPVIDEAARQRVARYRNLGKEQYRTAFELALPSGLNGFYVPPTIFTDVPANAPLAQEEIFGPILCVIRAKDLSEALFFANDTPYALTGGFYSRSPRNIARVQREFQVGNLYINRGITGAMVGRHPFGGFRMSGGGTKAGGADYLLHCTCPRVVTENTLRRGYAPDPAAGTNGAQAPSGTDADKSR